MIILAVWAILAIPLPGKWIRLESGPFSVHTDGSERTAGDLLARLQTAEHVFKKLYAPLRPQPLPVSVFILKPQRFRTIRPGSQTHGFYQSAPQRDYIVLLEGSDIGRAAMHEYAHLALNHTTRPLPQWVEEGLAEFYSTLEISGSTVGLGGLIPTHLRLLSGTALAPALDFAAVTKTSPLHEKSAEVALFYAQSWAMIHMLRLHERYRENYPAFMKALEAGESQGAAFQRAFGKSLSEALPDLRPYLSRSGLPNASIQLGVPPSKPENPRSSVLSDLDGEIAFAELALQCGQPDLSGKLYTQLSRNEPGDAKTATTLAMLALAHKRLPEAKHFFETALRFEDASALAYFEYAMLLRDHEGNREKSLAYLEKTIERNPQFAEAHFLLGVAAANENRHTTAIAHLERAASIFPRQSYFWHALALSYHAAGRLEDSSKAAHRAFDTAEGPEQAEMARAALRLATQPNEPGPAPRAGVITPGSWNRNEGDARLEGILERIDCLGQSARFLIRSGRTVVALFVENPGDVLLRNLSSVTFEFRCGPQKPTPIIVQYRKQPGSEHKTAGVITSLEFR